MPNMTPFSYKKYPDLYVFIILRTQGIQVYLYHQLKEVQPAPGRGSGRRILHRFRSWRDSMSVCISQGTRGHILVLSIVTGELVISDMWDEQ